MDALHFEDLEPGSRLCVLEKGTMTTAHIMRWSSATENWHRIHYDYRFATEHDKLPNVLINGSWKQHIMVQLVKDGLGPAGWLWKIKFRYKAMDLAGDSITGVANVVEKRAVMGLGFVGLSIQLVNQRNELTTAGTALGVLPLRDGAPVPYPFVPLPEQLELRLPNA